VINAGFNEGAVLLALSLAPLDSPAALVLLTPPSLRSDTVTPNLLTPVRGRCAGEAQKVWEVEKNNVSVLLGYFLIAAGAGVAASAIVGFYPCELADPLLRQG
jgi:hypothetical protein